MDGGVADAALGREVFGDLVRNTREGQTVEAGDDEGGKLGVDVELGRHAGAAQAAVLGGRHVAGWKV